ncbi:MAG: MFS transporter, partial [Candidatus Cloacimonetes bacterium]|nr:MFS transporter [Candidatus Cloacimonadota bacterium]
GMLAGIAIGSSQSSSRAMLALLTPDEKMAEFFGFYSVTGRIASILGPLVYGEVSRITGDQKWAILSVVVFFVTGAIVLQTVNEEKGKLTALNWKDDIDET